MSEQPGSTFPGEIRQIGHVVADLDVAMGEWLSIGVGPWTAIEVIQSNGRYRGQLSAGTTAIGFANVGSMQIELIEARGDAVSVWHEARDLGRFGPHHVAYWTHDFDAVLAAGERAGLTVAQEGDGNGLTRFVYFEMTSGQLIEVMELTELCEAFMDGIRQASVGWDGVDRPIRR